MKSMGEKIKELRKSKKYTQQELAKLLGVSISTISLYESDDRRPSIPALDKLAIVLGVDPSYFVSDLKPDYELNLKPRVAQIARDMQDLPDDAINVVAQIIASYKNSNKSGEGK